MHYICAHIVLYGVDKNSLLKHLHLINSNSYIATNSDGSIVFYDNSFNFLYSDSQTNLVKHIQALDQSLRLNFISKANVISENHNILQVAVNFIQQGMVDVTRLERSSYEILEKYDFSVRGILACWSSYFSKIFSCSALACYLEQDFFAYHLYSIGEMLDVYTSSDYQDLTEDNMRLRLSTHAEKICSALNKLEILNDFEKVFLYANKDNIDSSFTFPFCYSQYVNFLKILNIPLDVFALMEMLHPENTNAFQQLQFLLMNSDLSASEFIKVNSLKSEKKGKAGDRRGEPAKKYGKLLLKKLRVLEYNPEKISHYLNKLQQDLYHSNRHYSFISSYLLDLLYCLKADQANNIIGIFFVHLNIIIILEFLNSPSDACSREVADSALFEIDEYLYWQKSPLSVSRKAWIILEAKLRASIHTVAVRRES